jgi:hypothetical protein
MPHFVFFLKKTNFSSKNIKKTQKHEIFRNHRFSVKTDTVGFLLKPAGHMDAPDEDFPSSQNRCQALPLPPSKCIVFVSKHEKHIFR